MVIFTGYSPSSQLNIKHMYALAFSRTCDTVFFTCSSLNHDKFMFKVPFWNHTSGGACPKTPYIQGNQDKRFSVSAFSYTHRFNNLFIYGINSKKFARFFTSIRAEADNRHNFFVICWIIFHFRFFQHSSRLECVNEIFRPPDSIAFLNQDISVCWYWNIKSQPVKRGHYIKSNT